jgi:hypothetical protein
VAAEAGLLEDERLLERVEPERIIQKYGSVIADGVRHDLTGSL